MKKLLAIVLTLAMVISVMPVAFAAEAAKVTASVDYVSNVITVEYTNPASNPRFVNVYMANENDVEGSVFTNFEKAVRMDMKQVKANETVTITFKFAKDIKDGNYYFFAAPSGYGSEDDYAKSDAVSIISLDTIENEVLPSINGSNETNIAKNAYDQLKDVFGFEETTIPAWKNEILYNIKADDFGGNFENIVQITDNWVVADVIYNAKTSEENVSNNVTTLINTVGCDKTNEDYKNFKTKFEAEYQRQLVLIDANSKVDAVKAFNIAAAYVAINNRDTEGKAKAIETYQKELGISDDLLAQMKAKTIVAVIRNMGDFTVTSSSELIAKIEATLPNVEDKKDSSSNDNNGGSSAGSSGGSSSSSSGIGFGSGGTIAIDPALEQELNKPKYIFSDIKDSHWAAPAVEYLATKGIISGNGDGSFAPDRTVTREEFVKMIVGAFGLTGSADVAFSDVASNHWAAQYIAIAVENGIVNGVSADKFGLGSKITRQDMAVIIERVVELKGINLESGEASFTDSDKVSKYAQQAVELLAGSKVINGYNDGSFKPQGSLTRAEAAKVIYGIVTR